VYGIIIVIVTPIFDVISFFVGLFRNHSTSQQNQQNTAPPKSPFLNQRGGFHGIPPEIIDIARWGLLALGLIIVLLIVRASIRRWFKRPDDQGVEEVREGLDARSLLNQRWHDWWNRRRRSNNASPSLEPLDPTSARARYREFLKELANTQSDLARQSAETPTEYEVRLLAHLGNRPSPTQDVAHNNDGPVDSAILDELTHAYVSERYGGKPTEHRLRAYLQAWVPRLVMRLTGRASTQAKPRRTRS
jgi:hypothetical protein